MEWTFEELHKAHETNTLGLQYTIAQRERLLLLLKLIGELAEKDPSAPIQDITAAIRSTAAERHQDVFALLANGGKRDGFFVEFGACDGLVANNTYNLERIFGWKGLLAEPDHFWHSRLSANRKAPFDKRCVSSETGNLLKFFQSDRPGNSSPEADHQYLGGVVDSYEVETVKLDDLLSEYKAPRFIEFLSVDTEGHEKAVFSNFDFDRYEFGFICVEQHEDVPPGESVDPILKSAGYEVVFPREEGRPLPMQITGVDKFYAPKNHPWVRSASRT